MSNFIKPIIKRYLKRPLQFLWSCSRLNTSWDGKLAAFIGVLVIILGVLTYSSLRSASIFLGNPETVIWLLNIDLIVLCFLGLLIARRVILLYTVWRKGIPGARLHLRLVYIFGLLAMLPAVIMTIFSLFFFHYGVQTWFSDRVKTAVHESQEVAESYLREHHQVIKADILAMAKDLDNESSLQIINPQGFQKYIETQSLIRGLPETMLFTRDGRILNSAGINFEFNIKDIPAFAMDGADSGEVVLLTDIDDSRVRALVKLSNFGETYLYVGRLVEANVLKHLQTTKEAVQKYDEMSENYLGLRTSVTLIYVVVALLLLLTAIWFALVFARRLSLPITQLIEAAERVRQGDLNVEVVGTGDLEEFDYLNRSFNRMTKQIRDGRNELIEANRKMDERRQFTETILEGVNSGVLSLDKNGFITLANSSAAQILQKDIAFLIKKNINDILPNIKELIEQAYDKPHKTHQAEIMVLMENMGRRVFLVRVAIELLGERDIGAIITFDDITNLQSAQRKAAWADVARRIAHEIKNPLTPIQLSAERLKRKYMAGLDFDNQVIFEQCIDTIIRHVGNIGRMVNEFSSFARMPDPKFENCKIVDVIRDLVMFYKGAHSDLSIIGLETLDNIKDLNIFCDEEQLRQVFTNIIQNSLDSIEEKQKSDKSLIPNIGVWVTRDLDNIMISVTDNGLGFPVNQNLDSLTEPYVTFKEKGTGLGLAIVKKIMEDHGGRITFGHENRLELINSWCKLGGATVTLTFPIKTDKQKIL